MDASERGALMLVRFIAVSLIGWTLVELALYWVVSRHDQTPVRIFPCLLKSVSAGLGIVMLARAKAIAKWMADKLDQ